MWDVERIRARLRALAQADPEVRDISARRHRYRLDPPLPEPEVAGFERRHGLELPPSYRSFLTTVGSGGAGPLYGLYRFGGANWARHQADLGPHWQAELAVPFPHTERFRPAPDAEVCDRHLPLDEPVDVCWFTGSLVIAEIGCGSFARLVVTGEAAGQVWSDHLWTGSDLVPGPDFRDWYLSWLDGAATV
ncbi:SMI1/KNR4 family protein [Kitasatospora sp. NPDC094028]